MESMIRPPQDLLDYLDRSLTGEKLAVRLLQGLGNERIQAAVQLLGAHRQGFWLRELLRADGVLHDALQIDPAEPPPSTYWIDWKRIGELLDEGLRKSSSELAVLRVAASVAGDYPIVLHEVMHPLDRSEAKAVMGCILHAWPAGL
jgi:hypothetical protein